MVSVAASGITSWIYDPSLVLYALEQPEMLRSNDHKHSIVMNNFSVCPLYHIQIILRHTVTQILSFSLYLVIVYKYEPERLLPRIS